MDKNKDKQSRKYLETAHEDIEKDGDSWSEDEISLVSSGESECDKDVSLKDIKEFLKEMKLKYNTELDETTLIFGLLDNHERPTDRNNELDYFLYCAEKNILQERLYEMIGDFDQWRERIQKKR